MATVYLIDHEHAQSATLRAGLEADGLQVVTADEVGDWLAQARTLRPDCIVLAVELVGISGYSVCNKLKRDRELTAVPLLLVSSQASPETFAEHARLKTHADAYAHKPYDVVAVRAVVQGLLQQASAPAATPAPVAQVAPTPAPARRPARFGEEPSVREPVGSPFFAAEGSATEPSAETHAAAAHPASAERADAPTADGPVPPAAAVRVVPAAAVATSPVLITDAQILLERAVDTQNQTRIYDTLAPNRSDGQRPSHAELIAAALGDIDAAGGPEAGGGALTGAVPQLPHGEPSHGEAARDGEDGPHQVAALRAQLAAERARTAQLQLERDRALAAREAQAATLERLRQLLG